jgi:hypothetical protein
MYAGQAAADRLSVKTRTVFTRTAAARRPEQHANDRGGGKLGAHFAMAAQQRLLARACDGKCRALTVISVTLVSSTARSLCVL